MTINCTHTTTRGLHVFPDDCPLRMQMYISTLQMCSFYITIRGETEDVLRVRVCSISTTVTSGHGTILMLSANVRITSASACVWIRIAGDIFLGLCYMTGSLLNGVVIFWELFYRGCLEDAPLDVRRNLWFQHDGYPVHYEEGVQQWLNATYPRRWIGRRWSIAWSPRSPDLTPVDCFLWGHLKGHGYVIPPRTNGDLVAGLQAAV
jgi:hypothetical protein